MAVVELRRRETGYDGVEGSRRPRGDVEEVANYVRAPWVESTGGIAHFRPAIRCIQI